MCLPAPPPTLQLCLVLICHVSNVTGLFGQQPFTGLPADRGKHHTPRCTWENALSTMLSCLHKICWRNRLLPPVPGGPRTFNGFWGAQWG